MELTDIISDLSVTSAPETDYQKPAIITGHIRNRNVYPDTKYVRLTIPTLGTVPITIDSPIWDDNSFSFQFTPYALRQVSINPYMPEVIIAPGDSLHVEIDFADLMHVTCTGKGADNNKKLTIFHNRYYLRNWSGVHPGIYGSDEEGVRKMAQEYSDRRSEYLERLDSFIKNENPSDELAEFCRKEIETDYYSSAHGLLLKIEQMGGDHRTAAREDHRHAALVDAAEAEAALIADGEITEFTVFPRLDVVQFELHALRGVAAAVKQRHPGLGVARQHHPVGVGRSRQRDSGGQRGEQLFPVHFPMPLSVDGNYIMKTFPVHFSSWRRFSTPTVKSTSCRPPSGET